MCERAHTAVLAAAGAHQCFQALLFKSSCSVLLWEAGWFIQSVMTHTDSVVTGPNNSATVIDKPVQNVAGSGVQHNPIT